MRYAALAHSEGLPGKTSRHRIDRRQSHNDRAPVPSPEEENDARAVQRRSATAQGKRRVALEEERSKGQHPQRGGRSPSRLTPLSAIRTPTWPDASALPASLKQPADGAAAAKDTRVAFAVKPLVSHVQAPAVSAPYITPHNRAASFGRHAPFAATHPNSSRKYS